MVDFCVVGGGIVGLATAMTLLERRPGASVVILEKGDSVAGQQTGHNSGVIHAGVYYAPGSLKARLCRAGAAWTRQFCREQGISFAQPGKLIVATDDAELTRLAALEDRSVRNGLTIARLSAAQLHRAEPHVRGVAALLVAETGIVDYAEVAQGMAERVAELGGRVQLGSRVMALGEDRSGVIVETGTETLRAGRLVACGGIQADRIARMAGIGDGFAMLPFRGEYYRLTPERSGLVEHLIYPVPDPAMPFLGVHLTPTIGGGATVGPNAVLGLSREGYGRRAFSYDDAAELVRFGGFWRLVPRLLRTGVVEQWNSWVKRGYLARVRRYCPELGLRDLLPHEPGIRAQAVLADGSMVEDFMFRSTARQLHVINAPSPAATSARPIAEEICARLLA